MTITFDTAVDRLRQNPTYFDTKEKLLELVRETNIDVADGYTQGRVTVLYSGWATADTRSEDAVKALIVNGEDVRLVDKTQAARLMLSDEFLTAVGRLENVSLTQMKSEERFSNQKLAIQC